MNKRTAWTLQESDIYGARFKRFMKKNKDVVRLILNNLDTYFETLNQGVHPQQIRAGFIHPEPGGVKAIDQKGSRKGIGGTPKEGRLYVFPQEQTCILHLITIGDKDSQKADLADCRNFMDDLTVVSE